MNFQYRLRGLDYVTNLSPMHEPFHLYEFTLGLPFRQFAIKNNLEIEDHAFFACSTGLNGLLDDALRRIMKTMNQVWLKKLKNNLCLWKPRLYFLYFFLKAYYPSSLLILLFKEDRLSGTERANIIINIFR